MSALLCTPRDRAVLEAVSEMRVLARSEIRRNFFGDVSRQMADRRIHLLLKRYPELIGEERLEFGHEGMIVARAVPGAASTYREHDQVICHIRAALSAMRASSIWLNEVSIRTGGASAYIPRLNKDELKRIPDAIWILREPVLVPIGIEYERTLKSRKRILEIVRSYENRARCPLRLVLIFCAGRVMEQAFASQTQAFFASAESSLTPRTRIVGLGDIESVVGSDEWAKALTTRVEAHLESIREKEPIYGKAS